MRQRRSIITSDYEAANPYKKGYPGGHVELRRRLNIPVFAWGLHRGGGRGENKDEESDEPDVRQI